MAAAVQLPPPVADPDDNANTVNTQPDNSSALDDDPNSILNPSFIDLFIEESPPEWTLADLHVLHEIKGLPPPRPAPFQKLPVEIVESIALYLVEFRDIRALANSCGFFRRILFESGNHLFWYKWAKSPHSMCRWDLGYYRQNRAYQNTIVNQQSGRRRKRCEKCMARALRGLAFKRKTCMDCWEDVGIPAKELVFVKGIDVSKVPHQQVADHYLPPEEQNWQNCREWDFLYFFKPALQKQLTDNYYLNRDARPTALLNFAQRWIRDLSSEVAEKKRGMMYKYANNSYFSGRNVRRSFWYVDVAGDLISSHEVIIRMLEKRIIHDVGHERMSMSGYTALPDPADIYGPDSDLYQGFPKTKCELQLTQAYKDEFGEDLDNFHECDIVCKRKSRAKKFRDLWHPVAEERLLGMLIGPAAIDLTEEEANLLCVPTYSWQSREHIEEVMNEMVQACKWLIPGTEGDYTAESVEEWEKIHGKGKGREKEPRTTRTAKITRWFNSPTSPTPMTEEEEAANMPSEENLRAGLTALVGLRSKPTETWMNEKGKSRDLRSFFSPKP